MPAAARGAPAAEPHPMSDTVSEDKELAPNTIAIELVDERNEPVKSQLVRLAIHFETIALGQDDSEQQATTDSTGKVVFTELKSGSAYSYRVRTSYQGADYSSATFNLGPTAGQRVRLHVFPSTSSLEQVRITTRALYTIEPRDDVFQVDALLRISNHGPLTFRPRRFSMRLPDGAKGFSDQSKEDQRFEISGNTATLVGTFVPYRHHDVRLRFQIPNANQASQHFTLGLLPNLIESRVLLHHRSGMQLRVRGYGEQGDDKLQDGRPILWAQTIASRDGQISEAPVEISGIPVQGPARWWVVLGSLGLAGTGVYFARSKQLSRERRRSTQRDVEEAERVLLDELAAVERARKADAIGPATYERARQALVMALVHLSEQHPKKSRQGQ